MKTEINIDPNARHSLSSFGLLLALLVAERGPYREIDVPQVLQRHPLTLVRDDDVVGLIQLMFE